MRSPPNPDLHATCRCLALLPLIHLTLLPVSLDLEFHMSLRRFLQDTQNTCPTLGCTALSLHTRFFSGPQLLKAWTWFPSSLEMDIRLCKNNNSVQLHTKWLITASYSGLQFFFFFNFPSFSATWIWSLGFCGIWEKIPLLSNRELK